MAKHVRITNNVGGVFTPPLDSRATRELLMAIHGGCWSEEQTAAVMEAYQQLSDGKVFTHPRGYTFEPVEIEESSDAL